MMVGMWLWLCKLARSRWWPSVWAFAYIAYLCTHRLDPDFGWHFRSGQYILAHGVPHHDVFTYTAKGFVWINHEWLNDVFVYAVAHHLGYAALGLFEAGLWTLALVLAVWPRRIGWAAVGLALGALLTYLAVRPEVWTALGLALLIRLIEAKRPRYWLLVPLFGLWANLHAGFALGLGLVALKAILDRSRRLALWGLAAAAATLVNPYGFGVYVELWRTMSDGALGSRIVEWGPLAVNYAVAPYVVTLVVVLIVARGWTFVRVRGVVLLAAALWASRQLPLAVVGTLGLINESIERALACMENRLFRATAAILAGVAFSFAVLVWPPAVNNGMSLAQPVAVFRALKAAPCRGHVFNDYNYGGFMIWVLPGVPDYIDGRMPSWRGPQGSYLDRYLEVLQGGAVSDAEFARYNVQCAVLSEYDTKLSAHLSRQPGWRLVLSAQDAELWRRD